MIPTRRAALAGATALFPALTLARRVLAATDEAIVAGISGPLSGPDAAVGARWKRGFELALDRINDPGGIDGRPVDYQFEDSRGEPQGAVAVADKFVADPKILIALGDLSAAASTAASPIYQRGKLVQLAFTSVPAEFTRAGDDIWTTAPNPSLEQPKLAAFVEGLRLDKLAVLYPETDDGRAARDAFVKAARALRASVPSIVGLPPGTENFRPIVDAVRDAQPNGIVLLSDSAKTAAIVRETRELALKQTIVAGVASYSPRLIEAGGPAVDGIFVMTDFFPDDERPEVRSFTRAYRDKYNLEPDFAGAAAFDAMMLFAEVCRRSGSTRQAVRDGLERLRDLPSIVYGRTAFDIPARRITAAPYVYLQIREGIFIPWDGKPPHA